MRGGRVLMGVVIAVLAASGASVVLLLGGSAAPCPGCPEEMGSPVRVAALSEEGNAIIAEVRAMTVAERVGDEQLSRLEEVWFGEPAVREADRSFVKRMSRLSLGDMLKYRPDLPVAVRERLIGLLLRTLEDPSASLRLQAIGNAENSAVFDEPRVVAAVERLRSDRDPDVAARAEKSSFFWTPERRAEVARQWEEESRR